MITINTTPITHFDKADPEKTKFGKLEFLGGLVLDSDAKHFGGVSGFRFVSDTHFVGVTDKGHWLKGELIRDGEKPVGVMTAKLGRLERANGKKLKKKSQGDAEALEIVGNKVFISFERDHRVSEFRWKNGTLRKVSKKPLLDLNHLDIKNNNGPEALAVSPVNGDMIVFPENNLTKKGNFKGVLLRNDKREKLRLAHDGSDLSVSGATFMENGDLLLLQRTYNLRSGATMRLVRVAAKEIAPKTKLKGKVLMQADWNHEIDNMESVALSKTDDGDTRITIVSDNNFSAAQRTLLLEFKLLD